MNLHDLFAIARHRTPDKLALQFRTGDKPAETFSYAELFGAADRLAAGLHDWGLQKGDHVAFYLDNCPEFVIAYLAVIRLGAVMVPINRRYRRREIGHILTDGTPRLLITEAAQLPILDDVDAEAKASLEDILVVEDLSEWQTDAAEFAPPVVEGDDTALIMYTSGTTGRSKGAMISHNNVLATMTGLLSAWAWEHDDVLLLVLPLFHTHGLVVGLHCALAAGATTLLRRKFDSTETVNELLSGESTLFFAVPTIYVRVVDELRQRSEPIDMSHMRLFCSGSAPLAPETLKAFRDLTGHTILERYGMTETGMNLSNHYAGPRVPGSVGAPLPGVAMRIVNEQGEDVTPGEEGEIWLRGSNVFSSYWQAPEKTLESFTRDALGRRWFHTGDMARQDPESGYVTLLGRQHDLIISGGFNIYPREIEETLTTFAGVREAAVIGAPHPEWGEVPVACLVVEHEIDEDEIIAFCKRELAGFKAPREFRYFDELPRNAMGKLQKHLIELED
ncbi:MAG: Long-chain-fatty-acid--CoA ligase [Anaerolineales bacterium]|nr:Long-chain-fatty-acid--CoA ligase [Anaerolineales bacterium]